MSYIEFQNVKKIYKMGDVKIKALNGADFSIEKESLLLLQVQVVQVKVQFLILWVGWIQPRQVK